ncbi:MAG: hypothetical protein KF912_09520 [Phycisphaeraceae bacterium]|nr:hypothetical protein [Phycisphaeraceae bacterium]MBX3367533.1 hypothetical protein [Phycisphaeraceae bacterium]
MHELLTIAQQSSGSGIAGAIGLLLYFAIIVFIIVGMWKTFTKGGQPGWACIVPIFNTYILLKLVGRPWWWLLLFLIPLVNIVIAIIVCVDLAKSFGKSILFAIGLIFLTPIFFCILGFGSAQYQGPAAAK